MSDLMYRVVVVIVMILIVGKSTAEGIFSEMPRSINASLGSTVHFHCELSGSGTLYWLLNGDELWEASNRQRQAVAETENGRVSTLTIVALANNDNLTIHCVAYPNTKTNAALLYVQGLLDAPSNITANIIDNNSILLTWNSPFTLDLPGDPDVSHYVVTIANNHNGFETTVTVYGTDYLFQPGFVDECEHYMFTVTGVNVVGAGATSDVVHKAFPGPSLVVTNNTSTNNNMLTQFKIGRTLVCTATENSIITWNILTPATSNSSVYDVEPLLGEALMRHSLNSTSGEYSEAIEILSELHNDELIQCVALRVCTQPGDRGACVTSVCKSNIMALPSHIITTDTMTSQAQTTTSTDYDKQGLENDYNISDYTDQCAVNTIVIGAVGGTSGLCIVVLLILLIAVLCQQHKAIKSNSTGKGSQVYADYDDLVKHKASIENEERAHVYESLANLTGEDIVLLSCLLRSAQLIIQLSFEKRDTYKRNY